MSKILDFFPDQKLKLQTGVAVSSQEILCVTRVLSVVCIDVKERRERERERENRFESNLSLLYVCMYVCVCVDVSFLCDCIIHDSDCVSIFWPVLL